MQRCQWNAMKTMTTYKHRLFVKSWMFSWNRFPYFHVSFSLCIFKSHNMSACVWIKGSKNQKDKRTETERLLGNEFVNLTYGKTFPVGSELRFLVTSEAVRWNKWIWQMLTVGTKHSYEVQHTLPFKKNNKIKPNQPKIPHEILMPHDRLQLNSYLYICKTLCLYWSYHM